MKCSIDWCNTQSIAKSQTKASFGNSGCLLDHFEKASNLIKMRTVVMAYRRGTGLNKIETASNIIQEINKSKQNIMYMHLWCHI